MPTEKQKWAEPLFEKRQINEAGDILRQTILNTPQRKDAMVIVDNWRAAHAYPLHVFYMNLRDKASSNKSIIVAERLKRLESIEKKLHREQSMNLYRMQDIGGCRMILPSIDDVHKYSDMFMNSRIRHEFVNKKDYIKSPKISGYRSLHLVYKYKSDLPNKKIYVDYPMRIELQFRTHLQHIWATAIESLGLFLNQDLKAGDGDENIRRFFIVISSLFAMREGEPIVPGTTNDQKELILEIKAIDKQHHILDMLKAIKTVVDLDADTIPDKKGYYIMELNYQTKRLKRWFFKPSEIHLANGMYDHLEQKRDGKPLDIVMVRAKSYSMVKKAYPNYFMDIGEFVEIVEKYIISETYIDEIIPDGIQ